MSVVPVRIDPGSSVGPYVVDQPLARGGMGRLFLAHDPTTRQKVVLKLVAEDGSSAGARARLVREARSLASLDHSGIVKIFGYGEHDGSPWIAMEHVRGTDLKAHLADRRYVPAEQATRWMVQAADALAAAHAAGVVHRDLKPSNILLTPTERITIVDFGIAQRRGEPVGDDTTGRREIIGTIAYLSPEQLDHGLADERSDVWALGCVLFELCAGAQAFGRGSAAETTAAILRDEPVFPSHVTGAVVHVVTACLRKSSFARVGSARELALLLRDALENPASELAAPPPDRLPSRSPSSMSLPSSVAPNRTSERPPAFPTQRPSSVSGVAPRRSTTPPVVVPGSSSRLPAAPRAPVVGRVKGTAIRAGLAWFAAKQGGDVLRRLYDEAPPEVRAMIRVDDPAFGVIASGWYDTATVGALLEQMEKAAAPDDGEDYVQALTTAIAKDNVGGIYQALFKLISTPSMLEANSQRVWQTYVDEGALTVRVPERGTLNAEIRGWKHHDPRVCRVMGSMFQNILREVGYTALVVERTECVDEGSSRCLFEGMYLV
jgi:serine/threonine protein kinase